MAFPTLFSLAVRKEALVKEVWVNSREGWISCFSRSFNDWEVMDVENFLHSIQPWRVISNREDKLILKGSNSGNYSMKLMYEVLNCLASSPMPFLALSIWNPLVPLKVCFMLERCRGERC